MGIFNQSFAGINFCAPAAVKTWAAVASHSSTVKSHFNKCEAGIQNVDMMAKYN